MLTSSSFIRRSRRLRDVTYLPSRPASGDVLTWKYIASVGSSTVIGGSASGMSSDASVVPIARSSTPVTSTMSPAAADSTGVRSSPVNVNTCPIFARGGICTRLERAVQHCHVLTRGNAPATHAADAEAPHVARIIEGADLQLQTAVDVGLGGRHVRQDGLEQRLHRRVGGSGRGLGELHVERRPAVQRRRVDHREVELLVVGAEPVEQLERLVHDPLGRARPDDRPC